MDRRASSVTAPPRPRHTEAAAAACTDVTIHGLELDAYNEAMRSVTSGVRAVALAKCDVVDVIHVDGDIHTMGSSGTVRRGPVAVTTPHLALVFYIGIPYERPQTASAE